MSRFEYFFQVTITIIVFIVISGTFVFSLNHLATPKKQAVTKTYPPPAPVIEVTSNGNLAEMPLGITSNGNEILLAPVTSNGN